MRPLKILAAALIVWSSSAHALLIDYVSETYVMTTIRATADVRARDGMPEATTAVLVGAGLFVVGFLIPRRITWTPAGLRLEPR